MRITHGKQRLLYVLCIKLLRISQKIYNVLITTNSAQDLGVTVPVSVYRVLVCFFFLVLILLHSLLFISLLTHEVVRQIFNGQLKAKC